MTDKPQFVSVDARALLEEKRAQFLELTGRELRNGQVEDVLVRIATDEGNLQRIAIQDAAEQNFIEFAREPALVIHGSRREVFRFEAQSARTPLFFELDTVQSQDAVIPAGTRVRNVDNTFVFALVADLTIPAGELSAMGEARASVAGVAANDLAVGAISVLVDPLTFGVTVENIAVTEGGTEREELEAFRSRVLNSRAARAVGGPRDVYASRARNASPEITAVDVQTWREGAPDGHIYIFVLTQSGVLSDEVMALVTDATSERSQRPTGDHVMIFPAVNVDLLADVDTQLSPGTDIELVRTEIEAAIGSLALSLRTRLGGEISSSQIVAIIQEVPGVASVDVTSPGILTRLGRNEFANLTIGNLNITVLGNV